MNEEDILEELNYLKKKTVLLEKLITRTNQTPSNHYVSQPNPAHGLKNIKVPENIRKTRSIC
jgi:hypothetical protein